MLLLEDGVNVDALEFIGASFPATDPLSAGHVVA
jgi:hypothetical protein